jgi:apolipoprotein N-acyltransferase
MAENGYAVLRAGCEGYLHVSDRYGRVLARRRSEYYPGTSIIAAVPIGKPEPTTYTKTGDIFGWLSMAAAATLLVKRWA